MSADIIQLKVETTLDIPVERVLDEAKAKDLKTVVVLGYLQDDEEYFAGSTADKGEIILLLERLKRQLLKDDDQ